ncbi:RNA-directed DNA polymerase, eukaryota [Tanacetum coccineum]
MDPDSPKKTIVDKYDIYFQDDAERYMWGYEAYEQFLAMSNQEVGVSGSGIKRTRAYIPRDREEAEQRLLGDYFGDDETPPKYSEENFRHINSSISTTSTPSTVFFKVRRPGVKSGTDISLLYAAQSVALTKNCLRVERRRTSRPRNGVARELLGLGVVFVGGIGAHWTPRFEKPTDNRVYIDMNFPKSITIDQQMDLECAVSKEELKRAVWECGTDKSPGPDGFSFGFYRQFWPSIENDVFAAVSHFFTFGDIPNGCNSCFIALIPKVPDANMVKDFRPISLIGSIYKIIAKILANRLVGVLGDIVNEVQSAFITERQILDGPFILNEVIQWCKLKKKQSLIFKVDFEKAYDSVRWDFLDDVLKKFGFGNKWCAWIQSCLRSSRGSIIINGSPTEEFQFFKGLKQGDPLSPFLFILIMESLHLSFQRVVDVGMFKGINLSPLVNLSHMFYADDAVFVGQWCDGNINTLVYVLECFFQASGLRINMCKSKIMGVNVGDEKVKSAASKLGCLILKTPFSYLGTKVGGNMSRVQAWTEVVDKVKSRLSNWKMKSLSIGGRLTLLKSVLGSMPIFYMSIFRVPLTVLHSLESIRCHFFNGHEINSNKASWVKWKSVLASKEKGGLGVSSLYALNRALMMKWVWRFYSQKESLWARVIKAIYGDDGHVAGLVGGTL